MRLGRLTWMTHNPVPKRSNLLSSKEFLWNSRDGGVTELRQEFSRGKRPFAPRRDVAIFDSYLFQQPRDGYLTRLLPETSKPRMATRLRDGSLPCPAVVGLGS